MRRGLGELETSNVEERSGEEDNHALPLGHGERANKAATGISAQKFNEEPSHRIDGDESVEHGSLGRMPAPQPDQ